jgi:DNA-binding MarR family transcriptional regulator
VAFFDRIAEAAGLSLDRSTITILNLLAVNGRLRYSELSELLAVDRSTASRQVAAAMAAGLVVQTTDPSDGRARILTLTKKGEAAHKKASGAWYEIIESLVGDWDEKDQEMLAVLLTRLVERMKDSYYTKDYTKD